MLAMRKVTFAWFAGVAAMASLAACADTAANAPSAPPPSLEVVNPAQVAPVLTRTTPLQENITVSQRLGPQGGTITIPRAGFRLHVPKGAVRGKVTFTVTALAGDLVAYEFGPHGTEFAQPIYFVQSLKGTNAWKLRDPSRIEGAYFAQRANLDTRRDEVLTTEYRPAHVDMKNAWAAFEIEHFSGYVLASGRSRTFQSY